MPKTPNITELLYGRALHDVRWRPFDREADLVFDESAVILRLSGLHMFCFRQSLFGPEQAFGRECHVHLVQVLSESELLDAFLNKRLGFTSDVGVYDSSANIPDDDAFHTPNTFSLYADVATSMQSAMKYPSAIDPLAGHLG